MFNPPDTVLVALITAGSGFAGAVAGALVNWAKSKNDRIAAAQKTLFEARLAAYQEYSRALAEYLKHADDPLAYADFLQTVKTAALLSSDKSYPLLNQAAKLLTQTVPGVLPDLETRKVLTDLTRSLHADLIDWTKFKRKSRQESKK